MRPTPTLSAMVFVDGTNLLVELFKVIGKKEFRAERAPDLAFHLANHCVLTACSDLMLTGDTLRIIRRYWFGSVQGSADDLQRTQELLRQCGFEAVLFPKTKNKDEKGVDMAVAREMLIHAFNKNYNTAILIAGDADYVELVKDVKRLGGVVDGAFFDVPALSPSLKVALDHFVPIHLPESTQPALVKRLKELELER